MEGVEVEEEREGGDCCFCLIKRCTILSVDVFVLARCVYSVDLGEDWPLALVLGFCIARLTAFGGLGLHLVYMDLHFLDDRLI